MTKQIARMIEVGIARETSRGTAESTATFWYPKIDFDFAPTVDQAVEESGLGVIDGRSGAEVTEKYGEGSFGGVVYNESFGLLLYAALGSLSTSADDPESGVHTHSFTRSNSNQHTALTLFEKDENVDKKYAFGMLNELTLNMVLNDFVKFSAGFMSKAPTDTSSSPSYSAEDSFTATHASVKFADSISGLSGASASNLSALNLTISKNVEDWQNLGSKEPEDIVNKVFAISGDLEAVFDDETYLDYVMDGSEKALLITLKNTDVTIGTSSNPKIAITLAPMSFSDWGRGGGQDDISTQTVAFDGNFSISDSKMVSIDLINTTSSY